MTIVLTGAGSGGHITPLLAVAHELKALKPDAKLVFIGQRSDSLIDVPSANPDIDETYSVRAGKFRRYHGAGIKQILNIPTAAKNARDAVRVVKGLSESRRLLKRIKPDVIFIKGGYVGVPIGLAAAQLKIPFITHDSDALPGLANRIIARWAKLHTVALPKEVYEQFYPINKTVTVGVPVASTYQLVDKKLQATYRKEIGLQDYDRLLFITGGGNGAKLLNECVAKVLPDVLEKYQDLAIVHATGRRHEQKIKELYDEILPANVRDRVQARGFIEDLYRYSGAADAIIARAGATNIAEFAIQGKACIMVPNPVLTGGHQLKNAKLLADKDAVYIVDEADLKANVQILGQAIEKVLDSAELRQKLGRNFHSFAKLGASRQLAKLILELAG